MLQNLLLKSKSENWVDYTQDFLRRKAVVLAAVSLLSTQVDAQKSH